MEIVFQPKALEDFQYWKKSGQKQIQQRISLLLQSIDQTPFEGIGKPEALKHQLKGCWSRRINDEHRLIYEISSAGEIKIFSVRGHYE